MAGRENETDNNDAGGERRLGKNIRKIFI